MTLLQQAKIEKTDILNWLIHADTQTLASTLLQGLALTYEDVRFVCKHLQVHNRYEQLQLLARYRTAYQDAAEQVTNEQQQAAAGVKAANTWLRCRR
ncbi:hypothetical protein [Alishewanella sp. SMS8]|uniref:hypothetical protein n=1 Tax=Alishewanella sp. SMS8 TaxID=2994676 RepID=UPI002742082D|nr:hypothetical protein [Alishewanella sp. SMS8]MDP5460058.1 hypothetical protein [Alishewanella sp. SMS8]